MKISFAIWLKFSCWLHRVLTLILDVHHSLDCCRSLFSLRFAPCRYHLSCMLAISVYWQTFELYLIWQNLLRLVDYVRQIMNYTSWLLFGNLLNLSTRFTAWSFYQHHFLHCSELYWISFLFFWILSLVISFNFSL